MPILPYLNSENEVVDGSSFHLLPFCRKNCSSLKCKAYYDRLRSCDSGSYCCPHGLSSYVYISDEERIIFTGLKIKGIYDKNKAKSTATKDYVYNPIIEEDSCKAIIQEYAISIHEKRTLETKLEAIRDLLHETRSLNGQIKNSIDILWENNGDEDSIERTVLIEMLKNAHVSSFMISNRFSYFDSILNPALATNSRYSAVIFKKFDKMRKLLKGYQGKNVWITVLSPKLSDYRYSIYPTFETLLFILLENAIKYSPGNRPVEVLFNENGSLLDVTIKSTGPYCNESEILHLCDKGFRGENAVLTHTTGQGYGLNFAKKICADHNIGISFDCVYSHKDHGIKYGTFSVQLSFDNSIDAT